MFVSLVAAGCSPSTSGVNPTPPDLLPAARDLGRDCTNPPLNRVMNPSFESGDGMAVNTGVPASTIASWDGCCTGGNTSWAISALSPYCGSRSVKVTSMNAQANVLSQSITSPGDVGKQFVVAGRVFVTTIDAGATIKLDIWDLMANQVVISTTALTTASSDWVPLMQTAMVPTGGRIQVRINTSGNVEAFVDDLSLLIQ
jgi:hypothetical protein